MPTYTLTSYKDVYTLTNTGVIDITYTLSKKADCYNYTQVSTGTLTPSGLSFILMDTDGHYKLDITDATLVVNTEEIHNIVNVISSFVGDVILFVCACEPDCNDDNLSCVLNLSAYTKLLSISSLGYQTYNTNIGLVLDEIVCLMLRPIQCLLDSEQILGISESPLLNKQIISLYYLAFYFTEKALATDTEEIDYIDTKYKYSSISPCIAQTGIDIGKIESLLIP